MAVKHIQQHTSPSTLGEGWENREDDQGGQ